MISSKLPEYFVMHLMDIDRALAVIARRLEQEPDDGEAWAAKADILCSEGMYEAAIRCCETSLRLNPWDAFAWDTKGRALYGLGRYEEALACHKQSVKIEPVLGDPEDCSIILGKDALPHIDRYPIPQ